MEDFGSCKHFLICNYYLGGAEKTFFHNFIGPAALGSFEFHRVHQQFASFKISTQKDLRNSFAEKFYVRVIRHFSTYENRTSGQTEYANIAPFNGTYQRMYACVVCWVMESNTFIKIAKAPCALNIMIKSVKIFKHWMLKKINFSRYLLVHILSILQKNSVSLLIV